MFQKLLKFDSNEGPKKDLKEIHEKQSIVWVLLGLNLNKTKFSSYKIPMAYQMHSEKGKKRRDRMVLRKKTIFGIREKYKSIVM